MNIENDQMITMDSLAKTIGIDVSNVLRRADRLFTEGKIKNKFYKAINGSVKRLFTEGEARLIIDYPERRGRPKKNQSQARD